MVKNLCSVDECENTLLAKQLCAKHYARLNRVGSVHLDARPELCTVTGCEKKNRSNGHCQSHYQIKRTYGIEPEEYEAMKLAVDNKCEICFQHSNNLHVDHDHTTGTVRGLLCSNCNRGIGLLQENVLFLQNAISYIIAR